MEIEESNFTLNTLQTFLPNHQNVFNTPRTQLTTTTATTSIPFLRKLFRIAAKKGQRESLQYLIHLKGAELFRSDWKALHYASLSSIECLRYLLRMGFDINQRNYNNENLFLLALKARSYKCTKELLEYLVAEGVEIHQKNDQNYNAFLLAIQWENCPRPIIEYLVALGIDIHCKTSIGNNAFLIAAHNSQRSIESFIYLQSLNINVHCVNDMQSNALLTYLNSANANLPTLRYFVGLGIDVHQVNCHGDNLFLCAVRRGEMEMIKYVVSLGVNTQNLEGRPLFYAIKHLDVTLFKYLLNNQIDRIDNYAVLHTLIANLNCNEKQYYTNKIHKFKETFDYFLSLGAEINNSDRDQTPIQLIRSIDDTVFLFQLVKYLINRGSNIFHRSEFGSILHTLLLTDRNLEVVKYVIIHSLEINPLTYKSVTVNEQEEKVNRDYYQFIHKKKNKQEKWKKHFFDLVISDVPPIMQIKNSNGLRVIDSGFFLFLPHESRAFISSFNNQPHHPK